MSASELARHADDFLRVVRGHPQHVDSGAIEVSESFAHLFVVIDVEMTLAFRSRGRSDTGVLKHERVEVFFGPHYPWRSPHFYLRTDFPTALPHLTPGQGTNAPRPCLIDGSADEFFSHFGLVELGVIFILDQMAIWLARAAAGQLMSATQGWEPLPRYDTSHDVVLDTDYVRSRVDRQGGWTVVKSVYHRTGSGINELGSNSDIYFLASKDQTPLYDDPKKLSYTRRDLPSGNATGKTITAIVWPGKTPDGQPIISDTFFPETVHSLADLRVRAAEMGSDTHLNAFLTRLEQSWGRLKADFPVPIAIVLCVRRPYRLMNRQSDIELIPYGFEMRPTQGRTHLYPSDETQLRVVPLRPLEHAGPSLLRDVSGSPVHKPTSIIGCGSVGSKIALHLARAGARISAVADSRNLLPHNMARHGLIYNSSPAPKADVLAEALSELGQSPEIYIKNVVDGLQHHTDRRKLAPLGTELLINTTASLLVREALARPTIRELQPRVCEIALFGRGNGAFVFFEGKERNPTLPDLMATLYASTMPNERTLLFDPAYGLTQVQIGEGCGSLTMSMTDARLSAMTALACEHIDRLSLTDNQKGEIVIGMHDPISYSTTWRRISVEAFKIISVDGVQWTLRLSADADAKIRADIASYPGVETGGYLIGACSARLRTITVVDVLPAPEDSQRSPTLFVLGTVGAQEAILQRHQESGNTLLDVGTWHSHLSETGASQTDRATARKLASERAPPAVLLIATPSNYCSIIHNNAE